MQTNLRDFKLYQSCRVDIKSQAFDRESFDKFNKRSAVAEMGDRARAVGQKVGGCCAPFHGGAGTPPNTTSPGPRPASLPSGILIHPTVSPQYTSVTDRQDNDPNCYL